MSSSKNTKSSDFQTDNSSNKKKEDFEVQKGNDKDKHTKTVLTFERKKVSNDNKDLDVHQDKDMKDMQKQDKDMTDVHKQDKDIKMSHDKDMKDVSVTKQEGHSEGKGIINTIKEKVKDVLNSATSSSDSDKDKEKNKEIENKTFVATGEAAGSKYPSNLGASSQQQHYTNLGSSSDQQHTHTALGATGSSDKDKYSNFGASSGVGISTSSDKDKYSNLGSSSSSGQHTADLGISASSDKDKYSNLGSSGSSSGQYSAGVGVSTSSDKDKYSSGQHTSNLSGDKYSTTTVQSKPVTVDRTGLGAEHREVGYDKQANVIPIKNKDMEKDSGHKLDIHASVKTGSAAGSTSGSQASTYKTTESK